MLVTNQSFSPVLRWVHHISLKCCASLPRAPEMRGIFSALLPKISTIAIGVQIKSRFFNDNLLQWNGFQMSHSCSHLEYVPRLSKVNPVGKEHVSQIDAYKLRLKVTGSIHAQIKFQHLKPIFEHSNVNPKENSISTKSLRCSFANSLKSK